MARTEQRELMGSVDPWRWNKLCDTCQAAGRKTPARREGCRCRVTAWRARWRNDQGKQRTKVVPRKLDGDRLVAKMETDKTAGMYIDPRAGRTRVGELANTLVGSKGDPKTKEWYRTMYRHVAEQWDQTSVGAIDHLEVQAWVDGLTVKGVGPDTVRGAFRVLHECVGLALRARKIGYDACVGVKLPKVNRREMVFLTPAQVVRLADVLERTWPAHGWGLLVRFAAYSGCRAGEVGGLRVKHLDLTNRRVRVHTSRKSHGNDGDPKGGKRRWVDLPRQLCVRLADHVTNRSLGLDDRVWQGERHGALNHKWFYRQRFKPTVVELSKAAELPTVKVEVRGEEKEYTLRFHDLRHTCVALLIAKGAQQYEVMEHLGHANIQTTINTYGHLFPSVRARIRTALEETWDEAA